MMAEHGLAVGALEHQQLHEQVDQVLEHWEAHRDDK
jgi:hypothetical protein